MRGKHRGINYSVVRTGTRSWEWSMYLGAPSILKMGVASSELGAATRACEFIDDWLRFHASDQIKPASI